MAETAPIHHAPIRPQSSNLTDHLDGNRQVDFYGVPSVGKFVMFTIAAFTQDAPDLSVQLRHMASPTERTNNIYFIYRETDTHFEAVSVTVGMRRTHLRPGLDHVRVPRDHWYSWIDTLKTEPIRNSFNGELLDQLVAKTNPADTSR